MPSRIKQGANRWHLNACGLALGLIVAPGAMAQNAVDEEGRPIEEIVVTGSNIARETFDYSSPVAVIDSQVLSATGTTNLGELLQSLPQSISTINNANNSFSTTASGVNLTDLRNLGTARTLVLVNGRRYVSALSPGTGYAVDLNAIPTAVIERVEVLTGGASAVYGSDAVAGVVNVVTKTDFEGVQLDVQTGASAEGDKSRDDATITMGGEFGGGGNAWMSFGWSNDDGLLARDRDFSNTDLSAYDLDGDGFAESEAWLGSSFIPQGRFGNYTGDGSVFRSGLADRPNSDRYNRADVRQIYTPLERRFAAAQANYPVTSNLNAFTELNFALIDTQSQLEPFALDINDDIFVQSRGGTGGIDVASSLLMPQLLIDNLLSEGITDISQLGLNLAARRLVEFGPRISNIQRSTLRGVVGFDWNTPNDWKLKGYYTYGKTDQDQENLNRLNTERAAFALDVEEDANGNLQCVSQVARLQGCVPFNPFGLNTISPEAVAYLGTPENFQATVEQEVFNLTLSGITELELPGGPLGFAVGTEWREESGSEVPGGFSQQGIGTSNVSAPTNGSFNVLEVFGEVNLPVHERLTLDAAVRQGDYSTVGSQFTWKFGLDLVLHDTLRLRATTSESVRAPNISDLFAGAGETFAALQDPCDGITDATTGDVATNCRSIQSIQDRIDATGSFTLTQVESQSTGGFISGNPNVNEEEAESLTVGLVWQPDFAFTDGFSAAVDFYDITVDDAITTTARTTVLERCFAVAPGTFDPSCTNRAFRDPTTGALVSVDSGTANENRFETQGIDIEARYIADIGAGSLRLGLMHNYLIKFDEIGIVDGDVDANAGEVLYPRNRWTGTASYAFNDWQVFLRQRFWDDVKDSNTPGLQNENGGTLGNPYGPELNEIDAQYYTDLSVTYTPGAFQVSLGVNNLFDEQPPLLTQLSQYGNTGTNTAAEAYDTIGRAWYLQLGFGFE